MPYERHKNFLRKFARSFPVLVLLLFGAVAGWFLLKANHPSSSPTAIIGMTMGMSMPVSSPAGSSPVWLMYHSEDGPGGMIPASTAPIKEWVEDLASSPTLTATSGNWSQIWNASSTPGADDVVLIPAGVTVNYDVATNVPFQTIGVKGTLVFDPSKNTQLNVGTIFVYQGGSVIIKPNSNVQAKVVFTGTVNTSTDPGQYSIGMVAVGGTVDVEGSNNPTSWAHYLSADAGSNTITLASAPTNWLPGDQLILAGSIHKNNTSQGFYQSSSVDEEHVTIKSVSGNIVTLTAPLQFTHSVLLEKTATAAPVTYQRVPGVVAHVTRNVIFTSADPTNLMSRGHIMFMDATSVTVKNAELLELGRTTDAVLNDTSRDSSGNVTHVGTNQRGRYALHAHHLTQPFDFENNAVVDETSGFPITTPASSEVTGVREVGDMRWGIVNHDSYGTIKGNDVVFKGGAGIVEEYGTETGQIIGNAVIGLDGGTGQDDGSRNNASKSLPFRYDFGMGGFGYWFGGQNGEIENNVTDGLFNMAAFDYYIDYYGREGEAPITRTVTGGFDTLPFVLQEPPDEYGASSNIGPLASTPKRLFSGNTNYGHSNGVQTPGTPTYGDGEALLDEWDQSVGAIFRNFTSYDGGAGAAGGNGEEKEIILDGAQLYGIGAHPGAGFQRDDRVEMIYMVNSTITNFSTGITADGSLLYLDNTKIVNANVPIDQIWQTAPHSTDAPPLIYKIGYSEVSGASSPSQAATVSFVNIDRGATYNTLSSIPLQVQASSPSGVVSHVEFYSSERQSLSGQAWDGPDYQYWNDGTDLGAATFQNGIWTYTWNNPAAGQYSVSAKVTDGSGVTTEYGNIPVTVLPGNLTNSNPVFYRAIDFGGSATTTADGLIWEPGKTAPNVSNDISSVSCTSPTSLGCTNGTFVYNHYMIPAVDPQLQALLASGIYYGTPAQYGHLDNNGIDITNVPAGNYEVYLYNSALDENIFAVAVQDQLEGNGIALTKVGDWKRLGPYIATVGTSGDLNVKYFVHRDSAFVPYVAGISIFQLQPGGTFHEPPHVTAAVTNIDRSNPITTVATLTGTVNDSNMAGTTSHWELFRGPGEVYFTNQNSVATNVQIFHAGTYEFKFVSWDGQFTTESNIVTVDVPTMPTVFSPAANAAKSGATFYKGYDINGPAVTIEGHQWNAGSDSNLSVVVDNPGVLKGYLGVVPLTFNNSSLTLYPNDVNVQDSNFAAMLRSGANYSTVTVNNIPNGNYEVYMYVTDSGHGNSGEIYMNQQRVILYASEFGVGSWQQLGPYTIPITNGTLNLDSAAGFDHGGMSFSGISLWKVNGALPAGPDTTPPSVPTNLARTGVTTSTVSLSWSPATDNVGVIGYKVYRNGIQIGTPAAASFTDIGLTPATTYTYTVAASDASANNSAQSSPVQATTLSSTGSTATSTPDTTKPSTPINLAQAGSTTSTIAITWSASTDNVSVAGYKVYRNSVQVATTSNPSFADSGLVASTTYTYFVSAFDGAGNISATSSALSASTQKVGVAADITPPTASISSPLANATISGASSAINVTAADNTGVTKVEFYVDGSLAGTDVSSPYSLALNTTAFSNGTHSLSAKAYDAAGNIGTSVSVPVTISNAVTPTSTQSVSFISITVSGITQTSAQLAITLSEAASVVVRYGLTTSYSNATLASPVLTTTFFNLPNLNPGTLYNFAVNATAQGTTTPVTSANKTFTTLSLPGVPPVTLPPATTPTGPTGGNGGGGGPVTSPTTNPTTGSTGSGSVTGSGTGSSVPASIPPVFPRNLTYGDTGSDVKLLQTVMKNLGFFNATTTITQTFGTFTQHSVILFQNAHDINKSGFLDTETQTLLDKVVASNPSLGGGGFTLPNATTPTTPIGTTTPPTPTGGSLTRNLGPGSTGKDVSTLQGILFNDSDYPTGLISGYYGNLTTAAVKVFQAKYGIISYGTPYTTGYGAVGPKTRGKLNSL